jgi:hypothetical protein
MSIIFISGLAIACVLTAIEGLLINLGKWRGFLSILLGLAFCFTLGTRLLYMPIYVLAAAFVGLTMSVIVEQLIMGPISVRQSRNLPNRVDKL